MTKEWDDLSRALATGVPRRKALWMFGSAVAGGVLTQGPLKVFARRSHTSSCTQWCNNVFGPGTPEAVQCLNDAAHGRGACYECGPQGDNTGLCGGQCCPTLWTGARSICCDGMCCPVGSTCCGGLCCPPNYICVNIIHGAACTSPIPGSGHITVNGVQICSS
jgi:hypothetical protein